MADPPKRESADEFLNRFQGDKADKPIPKADLPDLGVRPGFTVELPSREGPGFTVQTPVSTGVEQLPKEKQSAVKEAMMEAAALEGLAMVAPEYIGPGVRALLPRIMSKVAPVAKAGKLETLGSMGISGLTAGGAEFARHKSAGTPVEDYVDVAATAADLTGPAGIRSLLRKIAPEVNPQTAATARLAERLGFKFTPKQLATTAPASEFHEHNATLANRYATAAADGKGAQRVTREWLSSTDKKLDQAYEYIFSPQNIFAMNVGTQDAVVNIVRSGAGQAPVIDKFIADAANKAPFLVQPSVFPGPGGVLRGNQNFLPLDAPQLREARDMIRKLQKNPDAAVRRYGNQVWDAMMDNLLATDPALHKELMQTNQRYRAYMSLDQMDKDNRIVQGNVDLQWLDDHLRNGWGNQSYRHGKDNSLLAQLGIIGKDTGVLPQPRPEPAEKALHRAMLVGGGTGGAAAGAYEYATGGNPMDPKVVIPATLAGLGSPYLWRAARAATRPMRDAAGRIIQRTPTPQANDLATRGRLLQRLAKAREPTAALIGDVLNRPTDENQ